MDQTNTSTSSQVSSDLPFPPSQPQITSSNDKKALLFVLVTLGLLVIIGVTFFLLFFVGFKTTIKIESNPTVNQMEINDEQIPIPVEQNGQTNDKFTFFAPQKTKLDIFNKIEVSEIGSAVAVDIAEYYLVGQGDNAKIYIVSVPSDGPAFFTPFFYYVTTPNGNFFVIKKESSNNPNTNDWTYDSVVKQIKPGIKLVDNYDGIPTFPETFTSSKNSFDTPSALLNIKERMANKENEKVTVAKIDGFDLVKAYSELSVYDSKTEKSNIVDGMFARQTYLVQPETQFGKFYSLKLDALSDNKVPMVTWSDGRSTDDAYSNTSDVCGGFAFGYNVIKGTVLNTNDLLYVGDTKNGQKVYQLDDSNSPILKAFYADYLIGRDYPENENEILTYDQFIKTPNHFLYKDTLGDFVIFKNEKYARLAECGKPVIYLYPTKTTDVSVKVGADIRISEPEYGTGWNVIAEPTGVLTLNGNKYESLFWEGQGNGDYPYVDEYGVVVKRSEIEKTLWIHLTKLGLNQKESRDFMEFWLPKMPDTPYVRLSWLGTNDMNKLAPLEVSPKPDTMIRVFLDFKGMSEYKKLKPQRLTGVKRDGFVLVEWGGLLR